MHAACIAGILVALSLPEEPFDYFVNSWATVGVMNYPTGTRIAPSNELLLPDGRRARIRFGRALAPIPRSATKTLLEGYLPVVLLGARDGDVDYRVTLWATPLPTAANMEAAYRGPGEGTNYLTWIRVEATGGASASGDSVAASIEVLAEGREAQEVARLEGKLQPDSPARLHARLAAEPLDLSSDAARVVAAPEEGEAWLRRTAEFWRELLAAAARFEVPDARAMSCLRASHVNQLIGNDLGELHAGEGFYDEFYIRDGAYQIQQLEEGGFSSEARSALASFLRCQRADGRFESQAGQLDANGQAIWALWQYYRITGDRTWLAEVYPAMRRAAEWTRGARAKDGPFPGLLPAALADGEFLWEGKNHIVGYDFWNLRGLLCTAEAARVLGQTADATAFAAEAADYRRALDAAWKKTGLDHFPPSWECEGTHWGNTETLWPTPIFEAGDPRVAATAREVRERFGGGFLEGTIRWSPGRVAAIHPYLSSYTTLVSLELGDHEKVVEEFYWYLLHASAAGSFPEGIYFRRRFAWSDTSPHLLGAAQCANLLRHMLIHEKGQELHLLPAVPDGWLAPGKEIHVERAPTHFGVLGLHVAGSPDGVSVRIEKPTREPPARVVLHLPETTRLLEAPEGVVVSRRAPQKAPWSFDHVVDIYRSLPREKPIPGLVRLPPSGGAPPAPARFVPLDLSLAANTDPFRAPFGVPNPGRFLFTGLAAGSLLVSGVPFEVIDPARNGGKGLVVLEGTSAASAFPREVRIPVKRSGRRLFFLGNVHGWSPEDEGAGPWGALAEYVVRYEDGSEQVLPLIAGRTTDDWAQPPELVEVDVGVRGDPWHLNVLGLELMPKPVAEVVFRDLGTPASPVLAAVTLETD